MKLIGNIIWIVLIGLIMSMFWLLGGIILCITIIGIPFGKQCFKMAKINFAPFGKKINTNLGKHPIANVLWAILFGWELALVYLFAGVVLCVTVIGLPFGLQLFKFAKLAFTPFGATVDKA